jgi:hypothetical protein
VSYQFAVAPTEAPSRASPPTPNNNATPETDSDTDLTPISAPWCVWVWHTVVTTSTQPTAPLTNHLARPGGENA